MRGSMRVARAYSTGPDTKRVPSMPCTLHQLRMRSESQLANSQALASEPITAHGWILSARHQKTRTFLEIDDGTLGGSATMQVVVPGDVRTLTPGQAVRLQGHMAPGRGKRASQRVELHADEATVLGPCDLATYPLANAMQKKEQDTKTMDVVRHASHFKPRTAHFAAISRTRARVELGMAAWCMSNDFCKVAPPVLTSSDCEGGGEIFQVVAHADIVPTQPTPHEKLTSFWSGNGAYLTVSTQLHLEAYAMGLSRVWTLCPVFRAEGSATNRHLAEFWMMEAEMCWLPEGPSGMHETINALEHIIKSGLQAAWQDERAVDDMTFLQVERPTTWIETPWPRMTYTDAVRLLRTQGPMPPPVWGESLRSEHERWLAEYAQGPIVITDYPSGIKPFYMRENDERITLTEDLHPERVGEEKTTVACFDLLVPHVGELAGGSVREERHDKLVRRMEAMGIQAEQLRWYTDDLRRYGGAPHGGFGIGMERFLSWMTKTEHVRDLVGFPRIKGPLRY